MADATGLQSAAATRQAIAGGFGPQIEAGDDRRLPPRGEECASVDGLPLGRKINSRGDLGRFCTASQPCLVES